MPSATPFELDVIEHGSDITVIAVRGELDMASSAELREHLLPAVEHGTAVLDLAGIEFCDSSGLRVLIEAVQRARARGADFRLAAVPAGVLCVFAMAGLDGYFNLYADVAASLED